MDTQAEYRIRQSLKAILESRAFSRSPRLRDFLEYVVTETLANRQSELKAYTIATMVFDRSAEFDPQTDSLVRVQAGRLRRRLQHYYLTEAGDNDIRISLPVGGYIPVCSDPATQHVPIPEHVPLAETEKPLVAVLSFQNLSTDPDLGFFCEGLTEELVSALCQTANWSIVARSAVRALEAEESDPLSIGETLGAQVIVEGGARKHLDQARVSIRASHVSKRLHLQSYAYDCDLLDAKVFRRQTEIAAEVATTLHRS